MFIFLQFVQIAAKSLIDFVLFYQIAQTHLELMLFQKIVTNHTSVFVLFCKIAETHLELPLFFLFFKWLIEEATPLFFQISSTHLIDLMRF